MVLRERLIGEGEGRDGADFESEVDSKKKG